MNQAKHLQLTLTKISYGGDSIGDDLRIEIEHPNGLFGLNKKIKHGTNFAPKANVGVFPITTSLPLVIRIIEQDLVFNDVGKVVVAINIEADSATSQKSTHEVVVQEKRGVLPGARSALFTVGLEVSTEPAMRSIPLTDDGWFVCKREGQKERIALPSFLRVRFERSTSDRDYFTPIEGVWQGIELWASSDREASLKLLTDNPQTDTAHLVYSISKRTLTHGGQMYYTTDSPDARWEKGHYDIEIPDAPHRGGLSYPNVRYARVWFRVGHSGDRYIHTGRHSLGCITVTEQARWDKLCEALLRARKGDGKSVGVLVVVD